MRADPFHQLAYQLVGELSLATVAVAPELDRRGDVAPCGLSVDTDPCAIGRSPPPFSQRRSASLI
jgi:hypothetical protein